MATAKGHSRVTLSPFDYLDVSSKLGTLHLFEGTRLRHSDSLKKGVLNLLGSDNVHIFANPYQEQHLHALGLLQMANKHKPHRF